MRARGVLPWPPPRYRLWRNLCFNFHDLISPKPAAEKGRRFRVNLRDPTTLRLRRTGLREAMPQFCVNLRDLRETMPRFYRRFFRNLNDASSTAHITYT